MTDAAEGDEDYFEPLDLQSKDYAKTQWAWLESKLSTSTADYIIVAGHYPVSSIVS
jgi:hypothetical protein